MNFTSDTWVALASLFVAGCALAVTIWQGRQNYRHNKLSVRPILGASEYHKPQGKVRRATFELVNSGGGAAIIKNFVLYFGNKKISSHNSKAYDDFIFRKLEKFDNVEVFSVAPEAAIQAGESLLLHGFDYHAGEHNFDFLDKINVVVDYQSIYQDKVFTFDSRKSRRLVGKKIG